MRTHSNSPDVVAAHMPLADPMSTYAARALADGLEMMRTGPQRLQGARVVGALLSSFDDREILGHVVSTLIAVADADELVHEVFEKIVQHAPARSVYGARIEAVLAAVSPASHFDLLELSRESVARCELEFERVMMGAERVLRWAESTRARPAGTVAVLLQGAARRTSDPWPAEILERWPELVPAAGAHQRGLVLYAPTVAGFEYLAHRGPHERLGSPADLAQAPLERAIAAVEAALVRATDDVAAARLGRWLGQLKDARPARG